MDKILPAVVITLRMLSLISPSGTNTPTPSSVPKDVASPLCLYTFQYIQHCPFRYMTLTRSASTLSLSELRESCFASFVVV